MWVLDNLRTSTARQRVVVVVFVIQMIVSLVFGNTSHFGKGSNGEVSNRNRVIFTPPGGAFSIWAIIFTGEALCMVWQLITLQGRVWAGDWCIFIGFLVANVSQAMWAILFPFETQGTMHACCLFIFSAWLGLLLLNVSAVNRMTLATSSSSNDSPYKTVSDTPNPGDASTTTGPSSTYSVLWWVFGVVFFSIHLGWLTAATPLQWTIAAARDSDQFGVQIAGALVAGALLATTAFWRSVLNPDPGTAAAIVWALCWISSIDPAVTVRVGMPAADTSTVAVPPDVSYGIRLGAKVLAATIGSFALAAVFVRLAFAVAMSGLCRVVVAATIGLLTCVFDWFFR